MTENIVLLLRRPPHGTMFPAEGLRLCVALSNSFDPTVIAIDDGVYTYLKNANKDVYQKHIDFLTEIEIPLWVDKNSIEERGLAQSDLIDKVEIVEKNKIE